LNQAQKSSEIFRLAKPADFFMVLQGDVAAPCYGTAGLLNHETASVGYQLYCIGVADFNYESDLYGLKLCSNSYCYSAPPIASMPGSVLRDALGI
jgi:hypothetical protein